VEHKQDKIKQKQNHKDHENGKGMSRDVQGEGKRWRRDKND
jgi:hypothetical protein